MNFKTVFACVSLTIFTIVYAFSQITIEGYTFETGNRGFLSQVVVTAENGSTGDFIQQVTSDNDGKFVIDVPPGISSVKLVGTKNLFHETELRVSAADANAGKAFVKMELKRSPGYIFEITLAEKSDSIGMPTNHIRNALIEVYNNTTEKIILTLEDHPQPDFKVDLAKGNHYTVMIRKKGYLTKRMEAFVDVEGCILCFEGIGQVRPGVSDNLSGENTMGTLLANVELEPLFEGKRIELQNIYYDLGKFNIRPDAALELDKAAVFLNDNPQITVELGSHTDNRGKADQNMELSLKRAQSAVDYLVKNGRVEAFRINARGYGEGSPAVKCGSDCTEEEYSRNRRSEIKILGIAQGIPYKTLEKIKYEENFDKMIAALQEEGQVKVPEDGEVPTDLDAGVEDVEKAVETEDVEKAVETEDMEKEKITKAAKVTKEKKKTTKAKSKKTNAAEKEAKRMKKQKAAIVEKEMEKTVEKEMSTKQAAEKMQKDIESQVSEIEARVEKKAAKMAAEKKQVAEKATEEKSMSTSDKAQMGGNNYTGHKIVVAFRRTALEAGHELYSTYPDLSVYQAKAGYYLYMTGDFENRNDAESALDFMKDKNANVYLVEFDNGNRVN